MRDEETYGANIIDILGSSFFLDYTIGEEVRLKLQKIANLYKNREVQEARAEFRYNQTDYAKVIGMIGDEYLRDTMRKMYNEMDQMPV